MKQYKEKLKHEIAVPEGAVLSDILDTDDSGYDFEEAILYEEVKIRYERDDGKAERV